MGKWSSVRDKKIPGFTRKDHMFLSTVRSWERVFGSFGLNLAARKTGGFNCIFASESVSKKILLSGEISLWSETPECSSISLAEYGKMRREYHVV